MLMLESVKSAVHTQTNLNVFLLMLKKNFQRWPWCEECEDVDVKEPPKSQILNLASMKFQCGCDGEEG